MTEIHLCAQWIFNLFLFSFFWPQSSWLWHTHISEIGSRIFLKPCKRKCNCNLWTKNYFDCHESDTVAPKVRFETWARDVAVGRVVNTAARCSDGDGPAGKRRREREKAVLLLCPWLPTAVFRSPSILTVFLGYIADAILSSTHQHLLCFQCQSLGMVSVCRSMWIVGINRGGKARRALFLWTLFGKRNVIQLHFQLSHSPPYNRDICQEDCRNSCEPPGTRINSARYVFVSLWMLLVLCLVFYIYISRLMLVFRGLWAQAGNWKWNPLASFSIQDGWEGERERRKPITSLLT